MDFKQDLQRDVTIHTAETDVVRRPNFSELLSGAVVPRREPRSGAPGPGTRKDGGAEQPDVCQRPADHVRTIPIPTWVKASVDAWTAAAAITGGAVFRAINKAGRVWGNGVSPKVLWDVVPPGNVPYYGKLLDLEMLVLTPRGRERTRTEFARLLRAAGFRLSRVIARRVHYRSSKR